MIERCGDRVVTSLANTFDFRCFQMTSPIKNQEKEATAIVWQADIRSPSPMSSVLDQDGNDGTDAEDEVNVNGKRGKKDRLWFEASSVFHATLKASMADEHKTA